MPTEEELKRKILQQRMLEQQQHALQEHMQAQAQQQQMEEVLRVIKMQVLEPKARERLANLKLVKPELATQLELYLAQLYQSGQIRGKINDEQMVSILKKISEKKEYRIKRK
ncbi:MAG: hypothetical protein HYW26_05220 [Candidatus Aenigmarchaeota archaeon]|nr:hypothetical protein [Candidatus Aenigmarchaeota archaeon]